jgi:hypothetical protein
VKHDHLSRRPGAEDNGRGPATHSRPFAPIRMVRHQAAFPALQYLRRITFMSKFAMPHQNSRFWVRDHQECPRKTLPLVRLSSARVGFSKFRMADAITLPPPDVDSHTIPTAFASLATQIAHVSTLRQSNGAVASSLPGARMGTVLQGQLRERRRLDATRISRAALGRIRRTAQALYVRFRITSSIIPYSLPCSAVMM